MSSLTAEKPWHSFLTIDLLLRVADKTLLHPFVAWMIPLCLRAQAASFRHTSMQLALAYAFSVTIISILSVINKRIAYGLPREVDLGEEVIVITGGASGLGLLIAEVYGMRGANVAVLDVRDMESKEASGVDFYRCDVGDRGQVEQVAREIEKDLGTPTILINNAGIVNGKSLLDLTPKQIENNFRVNLLSHFHTLQTFLPGMIREDRGTIVTVSSVLAHLGCKNLADYTAAKAGLLALHSSLKAELAAYPEIKTLLVTPGQLSTPLFAGVRTPSTFLGPIVEPVEVAKEIIAAIDAGVSGELAMPLYARWIQWLAILPVGMRRTVRWASGIDRAMTDFHGRNDDDSCSKLD